MTTSLSITPELAKRDGLEAISDWRLPDDLNLLQTHLEGLRGASAAHSQAQADGNDLCDSIRQTGWPRQFQTGAGEVCRFPEINLQS